jgi:hypothetical protein
MAGMLKALAVVLLVGVVFSHPLLLVGVVLVGVPVAFLTFGVGLWRLVWYGGKRAKDGGS